MKPAPTHEKLFAVGKSGPIATFNLFFLGLGGPRIGEFVGFIIIFISFPIRQHFGMSHTNALMFLGPTVSVGLEGSTARPA